MSNRPILPAFMRFWTEQRVSKVALALAFGAAAVLIVMVFNTAISKSVSITGKIGLGVACVVGAAVTLFANKDFNLRPKSYKDWLTRTNVSAVLLALWAGYSIMSAFSDLMDPQTARETSPLAIEKAAKTASASAARTEAKVDDVAEMIDKRMPQAPVRAPILDQLPGLWGEPGCAVVWRMSIDGQAFKAEIIRKPAGLPDYNFIGDIGLVEGDKLEVVGEEPAAAKGMAATLSVDAKSAVPRLTWADRVRDVPLVLERCEGGN